MFRVKEEVKRNGIVLKGDMPDVLAYLEEEQKRCGRIPVLQYIRQRRIEKALSEQFGVADIRRVYKNELQRR